MLQSPCTLFGDLPAVKDCVLEMHNRVGVSYLNGQ